MRVSPRDLKFAIFRDVKNGYKRRLPSAREETVGISKRGHWNKGTCQQEVQSLNAWCES